MMDLGRNTEEKVWAVRCFKMGRNIKEIGLMIKEKDRE